MPENETLLKSASIYFFSRIGHRLRGRNWLKISEMDDVSFFFSALLLFFESKILQQLLPTILSLVLLALEPLSHSLHTDSSHIICHLF